MQQRRYLAAYLIYVAAALRSLIWYGQHPPLPLQLLVPLLAFGLVLVSEPFLSRRWPGYRRPYLGVQALLAMAAMLATPHLDTLAALFMPLSFQAVLYFGRRSGFLWIAAFTLALARPMMIIWQWQPVGVAMVLTYGALNAILGHYAYLIGRAETVQSENRRLLAELQTAVLALQDHAARVEEAAAGQVRQRMARELHDSVTQTVFSMKLTVEGARLLVGRDPAGVSQQLQRLHTLAASAAAEIQMLVSQLEPPPPAGEDLVAALQQLAAERRARDGLAITLEFCGESRLSGSVAAGLYRIAQEALTNVARHARTGEAMVRLDLQGSPRVLQVEDRGCGFDLKHVQPGAEHSGLAGMAERARELGWQLHVITSAGAGTTVRVEEDGAW